MLKRLLFVILTMTLVFPQSLFAQTEMIQLLSDDQMLDVNALTKDELALLLTRGSLATYVGPDVTGINRSARDIIWQTAQTFSINPQFLLVLLQREQSLIEDDRPTQDQLDWAMGYAVCDDCSKSDPRIQKFKGFGKQVYYAAQRIRESYLNDLDRRGYTESGIGPGRETLIDQMVIIPSNQATAVLYTYTPHLHGNKNFVRIWNRWFDNRYVDGSLLQDETSGGIWLIQNDRRRPITSRVAFFSRFSSKNIVSVSPEVLEKYEIGSPIVFPNYSLLRSPRGTVYLLVNDERRGFQSQEAFRSLGFSSDEIVDVTWEDLSFYKEGTPIATTSVLPQGALLQDKTTGGVFFIQNGLKQPIMSREILTMNFSSPSIIPTETSELEVFETGAPLPFPDGTLVAVQGSPDIFVITDGLRRHIMDEATFATFGWHWDQIVWTNERSVLIHSLGEELSTTLIDLTL